MALVEETAIAAVTVLIAVIAVIGNVTVFVIIVRTKSMRTSMNYLIANLAMLDALTGVFAIPNVILERSFTGQTTLIVAIVNSTSSDVGDVLCKVKGAVWLGTAGSPPLLLFIAYERYMSVIHPFSRRGGMTKRRLLCILPSCYLFTILIPFPYIFTVRYQAELQKCFDSSLPGIDTGVYSLSCFIILFIIPSAVMIVLYFQVARKLWRRQPCGSSSNEARLCAKRNVIRVVATITMIFILCWGFIYVVYIISHFFKEVPLWPTFYECSVLAACINSVVNPVLYYIYFNGFRARILALCESCVPGCIHAKQIHASCDLQQKNRIVSCKDHPSVYLVALRYI